MSMLIIIHTNTQINNKNYLLPNSDKCRQMPDVLNFWEKGILMCLQIWANSD